MFASRDWIVVAQEGTHSISPLALVSPALVSVVAELVASVPLDAALTSVVPALVAELVLLEVLLALELAPVDDVAEVLLDVALLVPVLLALVVLVVVTEEVLVSPVLLAPPVLLVPLVVAAELSVEPDVVSSEGPDVLPHPANARAPSRANTGARSPRRYGERRQDALPRPAE